jgi:D-psicose/D-tagatose/L-ribulose 3-epimerase
MANREGPRIGINTWVWTSPLTTEALEELAPQAADMGFDLIEVPIEGTTDLDYVRGAAILRRAGLEASVCAAMGPDRDLIHPDPGLRATGMAYVRHCIDAAHALGAVNVVGPLYSSVGRTWHTSTDERARAVDLLVRQLSALAVYAEARDTVLCVEPLNRFETSFLNLASQAIEVVDQVNHPNCGIMLDTFHMNIEEQSLGAAIRAAAGRLRHLHVCENDRGAPGSGHVPWPEVAAACRDIGFTGPFVIESFTSKVKAIARAAAVWRPLAASPNELAQSGVRFLRPLLSVADVRCS